MYSNILQYSYYRMSLILSTLRIYTSCSMVKRIFQVRLYFIYHTGFDVNLLSIHFFIYLSVVYLTALWLTLSRSQWPRSLWHEPPSPARTLGVVGSNPTRCIDVCVRLFCVCVVLCVGSGPAKVWSPVQVFLPTVYRIKKLKSRQDPKGLTAIEREKSLTLHNIK
jgi:hypothetical protein